MYSVECAIFDVCITNCTMEGTYIQRKVLILGLHPLLGVKQVPFISPVKSGRLTR